MIWKQITNATKLWLSLVHTKRLSIILVLLPCLCLVPDRTQAAAVNQILNGSTTLSGTSTTVTLCDSVVLNRSILLFTMTNNSNAVGSNLVSGELTDEITLTFRRNGTSGTVSIEWQVIEFSSGVTVQRGVTNLNANTVNQGITAVASLSRSFPIISLENAGSTYGNDDGVEAELTSTTNLQFRADNNVSDNLYWQVVEYDSCNVQSFSISLSGTSATATLTSVDTTKTMLVGTHRQSGNVNADDLPRTELTNATTVTLTRVGSASTVTYFGYAIEFTDNTTVQRGRFSFASGSTSASPSISAVQTDRSIVYGLGQYGWQGSTPYSTDDNVGYSWCTMSFASTTSVMGTRSNTGSTGNVPFQVVSFRYNQTDPPGGTSDISNPTAPYNNIFLNRLETGRVQMGSGQTSITQAISPVDMDSTFLVFSLRVNTNAIGQAAIGGRITDDTTLTFSRISSGSEVTIEYQVFYFARGVYVQHGTTNVNAASVDQAISSVNLERAFVISSRQKDGSEWGTDDGYVADLTSSTNLQLRSTVSMGHDVYWQVIEMQDALVRNVSFTLSGGSTATTSPISAIGSSCPGTVNGVDTNRTFIVSTHTLSTSIQSDDAPRVELTDTNEITATRVGSNGTMNILAYVVEVFDGSSVIHGNAIISGTDTISTETISSVTPKASGVFAPSHLGRQGSTTFSTDDDLGASWATLELTSNTELEVIRGNNSSATMNVPYQVVNFANFSCPPLPVELTSFKAAALSSEEVSLDWQTATEKNNDFFLVQRSDNGNRWETLGKLDGAGNSNSPKTYRWSDHAPLEGSSYYRLKQVDFNGQFDFSDVRSIRIYGDVSRLQAYPNPTADRLIISEVPEGVESLIVFNVMGQNVTDLIDEQRRNNGERVLDLSNLDRGIYLVSAGSAALRVYKL